jgi:hypothetical protein
MPLFAVPYIMKTKTGRSRHFSRRGEGSIAVRTSWNFLRAMLLAVMLAFGIDAPGTALAQGRLDASYVVTLAGITLGKGNWTIDISDTHYTAAASGMTTGLVHMITGGKGNSAARGTLVAGKPATSIYAATVTAGKHADNIRLSVNGGLAKDIALDPPIDGNPERVPLTDEHRHGIMDPMTGSMVWLSGTGDVLSPEACQRTVSIFDGRLRYDLKLAFKRMDTVKAEKGYAGPVVVCAVYVTPIAGHIPSRAAIKYITAMRDAEVWLAPIAGTRVLVPFRAQGPTPVGDAVLEATQFIATPQPTRASANGNKIE